MSDELVKRLDDLDPILETDFDTQLGVERDPYGATKAIEKALYLLRDQAARIEQLTAEREVLEQDNHRWKMECENFWRDREKTLTAERDAVQALYDAGTKYWNPVYEKVLHRAEAAEAERDRLRGGIEYILYGYGLDGPDYRFPYGEEEPDWITDHLIAVMNGESHD